MPELHTEHKYLVRIFSIDPRVAIQKINEPIFKDLKVLAPLVEYELKYMGLSDINEESITSWTNLIGQKYLAHPVNPDNEKLRSIFYFPLRLARTMLKMEDEKPVCHTHQLGSWHGLTTRLGEDLFTTSLLALREYKNNYEPRHFQWEKILKTDFHQLNNKLRDKKLFENHMHLKGSSPYFDLNWLSLMNNPQNRRDEFREFSKKSSQMPVKVLSYGNIQSIDLYDLVRLAATLRSAIFMLCCNQDTNRFEKINQILQSALKDINFLRISFNDILNEIGVDLHLSEYIQFNEKVDYAINFPVREDMHGSALAGERRIYYKAYLHLLKGGKFFYELELYFYLYILITQIISNEFIQKNERYGFSNFQQYQDRKSAFIPAGSVYEKLMIKMAVVDNIDENYIDKLEARFHGGANHRKLKNTIKGIDKCCTYDTNRRFTLQSPSDQNFKHFFVLHFIKKPCRFCKIHNDDLRRIWTIYCRDFQLRQTVKREAITITRLRENNRSTAKRIFGIDAASGEVTCRPEVFAQAFRYLRQHRITYRDYLYSYQEKNSMPCLKVTYHVGEDFYDLVDGLRAIDEAIDFLGLGHGDRIGHGVAMGLDADDYYKKRNYAISLPLQNLLDNIAWMLHKIQVWNIDVSSSFHQKLNAEYRECYRHIFTNDNVCDLDEYIQSMALRDENPKLFIDPYNYRIQSFKNNINFSWYNYSSSRNLEDYQNMAKNVYNLNQRYHYDTKVKWNGTKFTKYVIVEEYRSILKMLQIKMRHRMERHGVAIESNPSSNYLISKLKSMADIPLFQLFPVDEQLSGQNKLDVSVNTDDQGVFYTSLTKEYSMLAHVLQQETNPDGSRKYSDDRILLWIERLIENGNVQCFNQ